MLNLLKKEEKKVEYIELIYDLIFVYIIGRNNSLINSVESGFMSGETFLTYILTTLITLSIWYHSTRFTNRYGSKSIAEHIGLFVNMYLLYYMADGTRAAWQDYYFQYNIAWGLILLNMASQYLIKLFSRGELTDAARANIRLNVAVLLGEAAVVFVSLPIYSLTGLVLSPLAMFFGVAASILGGRKIRKQMPFDFTHLTERVMLFVVFTFGEMVISVSTYFKGGFTLRSAYFSLMAFLIVAGLFLIYGYFYDHIIDREQKVTGSGYMLLHIFLITALNNIAVALEFMKHSEIDAVLKNIFLVSSFFIFYIFLFSLEKFAYGCKRPNAKYISALVGLSAAFAAAIALLYRQNDVCIALTVAYIYTMFILSVIYSKKHKRVRTLAKE